MAGLNFATGHVRIVWPHLLRPTSFTKDQSAKYRVKFLIPKSQAHLTDWRQCANATHMVSHINGIIQSNGYAGTIDQSLDGDMGILSNGADIGEQLAPYWLVNATKPEDYGPPLLLDVDGITSIKDAIVPSTGLPLKGGDWLNLSLNLWQPKSTKKWNLGLTGAQFIRHDDPLGGSGGPSEDEIKQTFQTGGVMDAIGANPPPTQTYGAPGHMPVDATPPAQTPPAQPVPGQMPPTGAPPVPGYVEGQGGLPPAQMQNTQPQGVSTVSNPPPTGQQPAPGYPPAGQPPSPQNQQPAPGYPPAGQPPSPQNQQPAPGYPPAGQPPSPQNQQPVQGAVPPAPGTTWQ